MAASREKSSVNRDRKSTVISISGFSVTGATRAGPGETRSRYSGPRSSELPPLGYINLQLI